jgi:hypothetical protein
MADGDEATSDERALLWQLHAHFGTKVSTELELIGQRMAWLVMSQSFLFLAYVSSGTFGRVPTLPLVISIVGLSVAVSAYFSIGAAMRVLEHYGGYYLEAIERKLRLPPGGHHRRDVWTVQTGHVSTLVVPPLFTGVWVGALFRSIQRVPALTRDDWVAVVIAFVTIVAAVTFSYFRMWRPIGRHAGREADVMECLEQALREWES